MKEICEEKLIELFEKANEAFMQNNVQLFEADVTEMTLCGALMVELNDILKNSEFSSYSVDIEYNRIYQSEIDIEQKTIIGPERKRVSIRCDLIVHKRGNKEDGDNLIALEMKKVDRSKGAKAQDRRRLKILTTPLGECCPVKEYIESQSVEMFGYKLGIFYEIDTKNRIGRIEYYRDGKIMDKMIYRMESN